MKLTIWDKDLNRQLLLGTCVKIQDVSHMFNAIFEVLLQCESSAAASSSFLRMWLENRT
uniref:Uncharacterized protein n=1 Tax=Kalanchoe fedtschenkoi TaxID=63787 RepID=A0A7N0T767_KALFE